MALTRAPSVDIPTISVASSSPLDPHALATARWPATSSADRAWRECDAHSGEKYDTWLLIYGQRIVEFHPRSFSPDAAQMAVIGEKLGK